MSKDAEKRKVSMDCVQLLEVPKYEHLQCLHYCIAQTGHGTAVIQELSCI